MDNRFRALRKKMERFNEWEAENRKGLTAKQRLKQFLVLYDLGEMYEDDIRKKMNEEHLNALIRTSERFRVVLGTSMKL